MLTPNIVAQRATAAAASDPRSPLFQDAGDKERLVPIPDGICRDEIRRACLAAPWDPNGDEAHLPVFIALLRAAPNLHLVPAQHDSDPGIAAFLWARMRVLVAAAGYTNWPTLARMAQTIWPLCPWDQDESEQEWIDALHAAHQACGWSVSQFHVPWASLKAALPATQEKTAPISLWLRTLAMTHILKHTRLHDDGRIVVCYRGMPASIEAETSSNVLGHWRSQLGSLCSALGAANVHASNAKHVSLPWAAVRSALAALHVGALPRCASLKHLPPQVVGGPYSTLVPDPTAYGFYQTGLRLEHVWCAADGQVSVYTGDQSDVLEWSWNLREAGAHAQVRDGVAAVLPSRYAERWPFEAMLEAFPNLDLNLSCAGAGPGSSQTQADRDALGVLFDLPLFACLLRRPGHFEREFPIVAFLPATPTPTLSTSHGKTMAAVAVGRVQRPGIGWVKPNRSSSAPDNRTLAEMVRTWGTAVIDEFVPMKSSDNLLADANLQTLVTGGAASVGRALDNAAPLGLQASIVMSAKALRWPADMKNRTLVWFLGPLLPEQDQSPQTSHDLATGKWSMATRLGALAMLERYDIAGLFHREPPASGAKGFRFDDHRTLARVLFRLRTGREDTGEIQAALDAMRARWQGHTLAADNAGTLAMLAENEEQGLSLFDLLDGLTDPQWHALMAHLHIWQQQRKLGPWNTPGDVLRAVARARDFQHLTQMARELGGRRRPMSERTTVSMFKLHVEDTIKENESITLACGATVQRGDDSNNQLRLRIIPPPSQLTASVPLPKTGATLTRQAQQAQPPVPAPNP